MTEPIELYKKQLDELDQMWKDKGLNILDIIEYIVDHNTFLILKHFSVDDNITDIADLINTQTDKKLRQVIDEIVKEKFNETE